MRSSANQVKFQYQTSCFVSRLGATRLKAQSFRRTSFLKTLNRPTDAQEFDPPHSIINTCNSRSQARSHQPPSHPQPRPELHTHTHTMKNPLLSTALLTLLMTITITVTSPTPLQSNATIDLKKRLQQPERDCYSDWDVSRKPLAGASRDAMYGVLKLIGKV